MLMSMLSELIIYLIINNICPVHQRSNGSSATVDCNGHLQKCYSARTVRAELEQPLEAHRTVNSACPVPHEDSSNGRNRQNPNGWVTWLAHRTLSGAPIDSSHPQRLNWWLGAINTPQPPPL
jgi:hypothetical protein